MSRIRFISIEKLLEMQANDQDFKLIDVLSENSYNESHIPGAINIPVDNLNEDTLLEKQITQEDTIIVYCASYACPKSTKAAKRLLEMGYKKTFDFKAGKREWRRAGLQLEK
ncbi:rhodanese-like domain-containing protein [Candidatus Borrarchaeum sp.]|uniref:rhodanese-like domain-containing protein n=1 Tax=Candidatus Borrarchaeum sp. TaxID=2846742 RepID=UPI00257E7D99|nr:rhodanese-like domain-containing protein [Candidatus Borrarchaeum sp.]